MPPPPTSLYVAPPPQGISVGLVYINTAKVREVLVKKQEKVVAMLKTLCAKMPRKMMLVGV